MAKTPEAFYYDLDGNLTNDGRWTYTWDAENRLVQQESLSSAPTASKFRLEFGYDSKGRRIQKLVSTNNGSVYVAQYTNRFVYDGWNLMAILNPQSSILQSFTWGLDLSGSLQGAGGVGGLLMLTDQTTINGQPSTHFASYDGNGNVSALVAAASGTVSATYEYGPFSEVLRQTGPMAKANKFRFSTKYQDDESDYLYYGYRSYNPSIGRWLSRDPIAEGGGNNLIAFCKNNSVSFFDKDGRIIYDESCPLAAQTKIDEAFKSACSKLNSTGCVSCMSKSSLMKAYSASLAGLCASGNIKVKCSNTGVIGINACARANLSEQSILLSNNFFGKDVCGWGDRGCVIAHEMLHLIGEITHPTHNKSFKRLHKCLGCPEYDP